MARQTTRVSRVLMTGPVAPFTDAYRVELLDRGYTPLSTVNELRQVARFSRWLEAGGLTVGEVSDVRVEEFLAWQRANWRHRMPNPNTRKRRCRGVYEVRRDFHEASSRDRKGSPRKGRVRRRQIRRNHGR